MMNKEIWMQIRVKNESSFLFYYILSLTMRYTNFIFFLLETGQTFLRVAESLPRSLSRTKESISMQIRTKEFKDIVQIQSH